LSYIEKIKTMFNEEPKELFARIISYFLSSLILPNIVLMLFLVYMSHNNFFSYDFFNEGIFGMKMFFLMTIVFVFVISLTLFSGIILTFCIKKEKCKLKDSFIIFILNFLFLLLIILSVLAKIIVWEWAVYIIIISILINIHISMLLFYTAKHQLISFASFIFFGFMLTTQFSAETARLLSIGLKTFGAGGKIDVTLTTDTYSTIKGKLLLLSPKVIYLKVKDKNGTYIYPIDKLSNVYIGK